MAAEHTGPDSIRVRYNGSEVQHLTAVGTCPGIVLDHVAAKSGPGTGLLQCTGGGQSVRYRAPGSASFGPAVDVRTAGKYQLADGADADKYCLLTSVDGFLSAAAETSEVRLEDRFENGPGGPDWPDGQGSPIEWQLEVINVSAAAVTNVKAWLDPAMAHVEIATAAGGPWSSPTTEGTALVLSASLASQGTVTLYLRKNVASPSATPGQLNDIHFVFETPTKHYHDARGLWRIFEKALYRIYWSNTGPPAEGGTPQDTAASLPVTTTATFADGDWWFSVSLFNGVLDSGFLPLGPEGETFQRITISGGAQYGPPPVGPGDWDLIELPGAAARISGYCVLPDDANKPTEWAIGINYGLIGNPPPDPPVDQPTDMVPMPAGGLAILQLDLPPDPASIVKVRVQTRRNDGTAASPVWRYSENSRVMQLTLDPQVPTAPLAADVWSKPLGRGST